MFQPTEFFAAFSQHNLLVDVVFAPPLVEPVIFKAGFTRPAELGLTDAVQSDEYVIEYEFASALAMTQGDEVSIGGEIYRLRSPPRRRGDGSFVTAQLTKVAE